MTVDNSDIGSDLKLHDLRCFEAVARLGSFQAAARSLHRSHPSVFAAVARLEDRLGLALFDRSGYRPRLTAIGETVYDRTVASLRGVDSLAAYAAQLRQGEETVFRVVLGDLCPRPAILAALSAFFADRTRTRLHLDYEAVGGPAERLREGSADLIFHRPIEPDLTLERIDVATVALIPVAAPDFLPVAPADLTLEDLRPLTQCVIRDTARTIAGEDHFLIDGAYRCTVPDHAMKRELILHGLGWGHLPAFMVEDDLRSGALVNLQSGLLRGKVETLCAIRRRDVPHGPVATALWAFLAVHFAQAT